MTTPTALTTPLGDEILKLKAGDRVTLSGIIYTARDEAHKMIQERGFPFNPVGAVIYHCGPVIKDNKIIVAGPTTSARMNPFTGFMIDAGIKAFIGKGGMNAAVLSHMQGKSVYFAATGGCASLLKSYMTLTGVFFEELGMAEAIWQIRLDNLPLVVAMDSSCGDLFAKISDHAHEVFHQMDPTFTPI